MILPARGFVIDNFYLEYALEHWAQWACFDSPSFGSTCLSSLIRDGYCIHSSPPGSVIPTGVSLNSTEWRVNRAVEALAAVDSLTADVLRVEYNAAWWRVARLALATEHYTPINATQAIKALALTLSLRTYVRRLHAAKSFLQSSLEEEAKRRRNSRTCQAQEARTMLNHAH